MPETTPAGVALAHFEVACGPRRATYIAFVSGGAVTISKCCGAWIA